MFKPKSELDLYRDSHVDLVRENQELKIALYVMAGLFLLIFLARR